MQTEKLTVSWDEIGNPKVDERLKLLDSAAAAVNGASARPPEPATAGKGDRLIYNTLICMTFFGFLGGLLGWGLGEGLNFRGSARQEARDFLDARGQIEDLVKSGNYTPTDGQHALEEIDSEARDNPYYQLARNEKLSPDERDRQRGLIEKRDQWKDFLTDLLFYGVSGMTIAICLGIAEPAVERNWRGVTINGSVAAVLGLLGGVVVSLFVNQFRDLVVGVIADAQTPLVRQIVADSVQWGTLGLFLGLAPGVVLRSARKTSAGAIGGLVGGLIGGALFQLVNHLSGNNQHVSKLVAVSAIGLIAGLGTGLIENAVKTGWLKVTAGLIAGKQFILYRDPTFIGSSLSCHIYLFRDPSVGKRHAAVHIVPGGFEIENLPLGGQTLVNDEAVVARRKLRSGDRIQVGSTVMAFQEKAQAA